MNAPKRTVKRVSIDQLCTHKMPSGASIAVTKVIRGSDRETIFVGANGRLYHEGGSSQWRHASYYSKTTLNTLARAGILDRKEVDEYAARQERHRVRADAAYDLGILKMLASKYGFTITDAQRKAIGEKLRVVSK